VTDVLGLWDPDALEQEVRRKAAPRTSTAPAHAAGDLTANYAENEGMRTVWRHDPR
jgi:hypothetical protein